MPIINTVVSGGQGGGGDTVTALVGSNAHNVTVGDKVVLNTPATNETGYGSEYRFQNYSYTSEQWAIFFGSYMMYRDTSGKPVFLKHDTVNDRLIYLGKGSTSLAGLPYGGSTGDYAMKITYNETTKRFAICKSDSLVIYQAIIDETTNTYEVIQIAAFSTVRSFGGIAQDTDTLWYLQTADTPDSLVVQDFTYSDEVFTASTPYTHSNTSQTMTGSGGRNFGCFMSPCLHVIAFTNGTANDTSSCCSTACFVDKENKTIVFSSSLLSISTSTSSSSPAAGFNTNTTYYNMWLDDNGRGVLWNYPGANTQNDEYSQAIYFTTSSLSFVGSPTSTGNKSGIFGHSSTYQYYLSGQPGIVHKTGDWLTGGMLVFTIDANTGSYNRNTMTPTTTTSTGSAYMAGAMIAAISSTGIFMYPYRITTSNSGPISVKDYLVRWNNGSPVRGDTYLEPASDVGMPFYFDGNYLYATGGVYATDGAGGLTRLGNSGIYASMRDPKIYPPLFLPNNVIGLATLYNNGSVYMDFFEAGLATGSTYQGANNDFISDVRLDSSKTGFVIGTGDYRETYAVMHVTGGGRDAYNGNYKNGSSGQCIGFFDASGNPYCYKSNAIYSVTYDGTSTLVFTSLFTTSTVAGLLSGTTYWKTIAAGDRVDNYQMWFEANNQIFGFTKLDIANSKIDAVATPTALQEITGTIRAAWWDLQNRLTIRTDVGLYVFSYTNHDLSTMTIVKKFEWASDYAGPATCSSDLNSYATGGYNSYLKVATDVPNGSYTYSANVYTGHNFATTSLTGIVSKAPYTDDSDNTVVDVDTILP